MTPEQRLDRVERILVLFVKAGRRGRGEYRQQSREQEDKINILIQTQIETEEIMKRLAVSQAELTESQKLTDKAVRETQKAVRDFINSHHKRENGSN